MALNPQVVQTIAAEVSRARATHLRRRRRQHREKDTGYRRQAAARAIAAGWRRTGGHLYLPQPMIHQAEQLGRRYGITYGSVLEAAIIAGLRVVTPSALEQHWHKHREIIGVRFMVGRPRPDPSRFPTDGPFDGAPAP